MCNTDRQIISLNLKKICEGSIKYCQKSEQVSSPKERKNEMEYNGKKTNIRIHHSPWQSDTEKLKLYAA